MSVSFLSRSVFADYLRLLLRRDAWLVAATLAGVRVDAFFKLVDFLAALFFTAFFAIALFADFFGAAFFAGILLAGALLAAVLLAARAEPRPFAGAGSAALRYCMDAVKEQRF